LQTKDLAFSEAKNELVFERKKAKSNPKRGPKNHFLCGIEPEFTTRKAAPVG
jgi:hypothetical protein